MMDEYILRHIKKLLDQHAEHIEYIYAKLGELEARMAKLEDELAELKRS
jgi:hypothetical protein